MTDAICIDETRCLLGESPIWSPAEQALYWVDIQNAMIYRLHPESGERRNWPLETEIGSIGLGPDGKLICGLRMGLAWFDFETGEIEVIADPEGDKQWNTIRLNDGKVDRAGRYWCGSMEDPGQGPKGTLYRFDADGNSKAMLTDIQVPNAICWSPDNSVMYFADTREDRIRAYDFDLAAGEISNERIFVDLADVEGHPDGATVDAEGYLWSAQIYGGRVARYAPDGTLDRVVEIPTPLVTCCAFGGTNMDTLYVTTASFRMDREALAADPLAGKTFAIDVGVKGLAEPCFGQS
jgi:L-arabinonolactonase